MTLAVAHGREVYVAMLQRLVLMLMMLTLDMPMTLSHRRVLMLVGMLFVKASDFQRPLAG